MKEAAKIFINFETDEKGRKLYSLPAIIKEKAIL
jgi:hypothetical protein